MLLRNGILGNGDCQGSVHIAKSVRISLSSQEAWLDSRTLFQAVLKPVIVYFVVLFSGNRFGHCFYYVSAERVS